MKQKNYEILIIVILSLALIFAITLPLHFFDLLAYWAMLGSMFLTAFLLIIIKKKGE